MKIKILNFEKKNNMEKHMTKKKALTLCLLMSYLYVTNVNHIHANTCVTQQELTRKRCDAEREVTFEDDLDGLRDLITRDEDQKKHIKSFEELNIVIKATSEYHCPRGHTIEVTIKNNQWTVIIKNVPEDLLFECLPIDELLPQMTIKNKFEKYINAVSRAFAKAIIYIWAKTLAKYSKCSIIIQSNVQPDKRDFQCSEIILDTVELAENKEISVERSFEGLLSSKIIISKKN